MHEPRRPTPDERWSRRVAQRIEIQRDRLRSGRELRRAGGGADSGDGPGSGIGQPLLLVALTAVGSAALVLGVLWAWQSWSTRSTPPIDDALPMLVSQPTAGDTEGSTVAPAADAEPAAGAATQSDPTPEAAGEAVPAESDGGVAPGDGDPSAPAATAVPPPIIVHVSGAVLDPGVVDLVAGARVYEAVQAAGGSAADADLDRVNLAAPLVDGERIHVPAIGEDAPPELVPSVRPATAPAGDAAASGVSPTPTPLIVDLNRASALELEALPGIGPATSQAIVSTRDARGPFHSVDELLEVPGIGPAKLEQLRPHVWVQSS
jgi:competence protein ComEA